MDRSRSTWCMRYRTTTEDRAAQTGPGRTAVMTLETKGYSYPRKSDVGVDFAYSHRHPTDRPDPAFDEKADRFLKAAEFVDF